MDKGKFRGEKSPVLSQEQLDTFNNEGAVLIKGLVDEEWRAVLGAVVEDVLENAADSTGYHGDKAGEARSSLLSEDNFLKHPDMLRFLRDSPIAEIAALGMGSRSARLYEDLLIYRAGGTTEPTPWHQDEPQWPVSGTHMSSIWFSLDGTTPDTGALRFIKGSHKGPLYVPYVPDWQRDNLEQDMHYFTGGPLPDVVADSERFPVRSFVTEPGDAILFHPRTIHAAFGGHSERPRRTFSIRFIGDDIRWQPKASVFFDWLREINLPAGAPMVHERFPQFWPHALETV